VKSEKVISKNPAHLRERDFLAGAVGLVVCFAYYRLGDPMPLAFGTRLRPLATKQSTGLFCFTLLPSRVQVTFTLYENKKSTPFGVLFLFWQGQ